MLIAQQKQKENIVEYLLYMYQIEDLVRSLHCDFPTIQSKLIPSVLPNPSYRLAYEGWYAQICEELLRTGKQQRGHLYELEEIFTELALLHRTLLEVLKDEKYTALAEQAQKSIEEYAHKSSLLNAHPVEICLHAMYMKLQLKLRKQSISDETEKAMDPLRALLAYLSREYKNMKSGLWGVNLN
ncbi:MAG: DUF4924 family protein [Bacteroidetes bacterium]|nr:DUF4924 family protein [Bacteroidota bacterium]